MSRLWRLSKKKISLLFLQQFKGAAPDSSTIRNPSPLPRNYLFIWNFKDIIRLWSRKPLFTYFRRDNFRDGLVNIRIKLFLYFIRESINETWNFVCAALIPFLMEADWDNSSIPPKRRWLLLYSSTASPMPPLELTDMAATWKLPSI